MYSPFKASHVLRLALVAVLTGPLAHAQLLLSGNLTGEVTDTAGPNDTIYNASDGSSAWIKSGIPETSADKQTAIEFSQKNFTDIGPGLVADDIFKVTNGRTLLHSTATDAHFNLTLALTSPESHSSLLSIPFTIENTPNGDGNVDDVYGITAGPIAPFMIDSYKVEFTFVAPDSFILPENNSTYVGKLYVNFTPVPEPSTYAAAGAAFLMGLVGFRAFRRRSQIVLANAG